MCSSPPVVIIRFYIVMTLLAFFASPAAAANYEGQWFARVQVGSDVLELSLIIGGGGYVLQFQSADKFRRGLVEFTAPDRLRLIVQEYAPTEYQGQPLSQPPDSNFTIVSNDGQTMVLLDNNCAVAMAERSCTLVWERL